jgi:hypothetical protein
VRGDFVVDRVERAIFSILNRKYEVYYEEFDAWMLKRFKTLSQKELHERMIVLETEGKVGWFNGHWHSNWPQNYLDRLTKQVNSFDQGFNQTLKSSNVLDVDNMSIPTASMQS